MPLTQQEIIRRSATDPAFRRKVIQVEKLLFSGKERAVFGDPLGRGILSSLKSVQQSQRQAIVNKLISQGVNPSDIQLNRGGITYKEPQPQVKNNLQLQKNKFMERARLGTQLKGQPQKKKFIAISRLGTQLKGQLQRTPQQNRFMPTAKVGTQLNGQPRQNNFVGIAKVGTQFKGKLKGKVGNKPISTVTAVKKEKIKIDGVMGTIDSALKRVNQELTERKFRALDNREKTIVNKLLLAGIGVSSVLIETLIGIRQTPQLIRDIVANPTIVKRLPSAFKQSIKQEMRYVQISPSYGVARIGTSFLVLKGTGKVLKATGGLTSKGVNKFSPFLKRFKNNQLTIKVPRSAIKIKNGNLFVRIARRIEPILSKKQEITLTKGVIGKGTPLSKQVAFAGKRLPNIVTVQAQRLVNFLRRNKVLRKPIPNEESLLPLTKRLLKRFDDGRITSKQFIELNKRLIRETGDKTILERSLYADPKGTIRYTRLGKAGRNEANLLDILTGDFTIKPTAKPQIIVFPEGQIQKFPKSLKNIVKKLKRGINLNESERIKLVKWQVKKTGKFKPIGDIKYRGGVELEVTIAPGEIIRRVRKLGTTVIDGQRIEIVQAKIIKLKPKTKKLLNKARKTELNKIESEELRKLLKKETNLPVTSKDIKNIGRSVRRRPTPSTKRIGLRRKVISRALKRKPRTLKKKPSRITPKRKTPKRKTTTRKTPKRTTTTRKPILRTTTRKTPKRTTTTRKPTPRTPTPRTPLKRTPRIPPKTIKPTTPIPKRINSKNIKKLKRSQPVFDVYYKSKGKMVKANKIPLTKLDARDLMSYKIDNSITKRGKFVPRGISANVGNVPNIVKGYFNRNKKKLRPYRIKQKKKKSIRGYIEKRKYFSDTKGEKLALKRKRKPLTAIQKKQLVLRLKKGKRMKKIQKK